MYHNNNVFTELAARVRRGDVGARERFRAELEGVLVVMVRQTLRDGRDVGAIGRRILAVARRLSAGDGARPPDADELVREVAHSVCDKVVARLQPSCDAPTARDTFTANPHSGTVLVGRVADGRG